MNEIYSSPYDLVADALKVPRGSIKDADSMGQHPFWDSMRHLQIIVALEKSYQIQIPDSDIMKYDNMQAIVELFELKSGKRIQKSKGFKEWFKQSLVGKIFYK
ncbi:acyl carrier protein [Sediminibacterium sp.]|uniref:acyl carrier protein n=1 Tax=Sediminibacterium sp. TaxID=1917865 RepID=UPI0025D47DC4|nr:acyl carrier protein [Sediminibacterium sp.]